MKISAILNMITFHEVYQVKRLSAFILAFVLIVLTFTSCQEDSGTELYYPVTEDFSSLDPQIVSGTSSKLIAFNCYEGLVRLDENGEIASAGASSWDVSSDSLVYTFYLREDAQWYLTNTSKEALSGDDESDSLLSADFDVRVTAYDYVFGLRRALDPGTGADDGLYLEAIQNGADVLNGDKDVEQLGIVALDDFTLQITLDYADPDFLYYLTRPVATPCNEEFFNACRGRYGLAMEYMLCNGAYIVYRWTIGSVIRLEKNPLYTGDAQAQNNTVWVYYVSDADSVADKIKAGNYDAGYVTADEGESLVKKSGFTLESCTDVLWGYWFNCQSDIFSVADMRMAFASSVDSSVLSPPEYIENSTDRLLTSAMSPYYDFTPTFTSYDETAANEYFLNAVNENDDLSTSITVTVLTAEDFADSVIKQIQIWQRIFGIDVKIKTETRENAESLMQSGDYEIAFLPVEFASFNTSEYFRSYMSDSSYNVTGYSNTSYDSLINSITYSMTEDEKTAVYKECEQTLISDAVVIPMYTEASYFVQGKGVSGIYFVSKEEVYFRNGTIS